MASIRTFLHLNLRDAQVHAACHRRGRKRRETETHPLSSSSQGSHPAGTRTKRKRTKDHSYNKPHHSFNNMTDRSFHLAKWLKSLVLVSHKLYSISSNTFVKSNSLYKWPWWLNFQLVTAVILCIRDILIISFSNDFWFYVLLFRLHSVIIRIKIGFPFMSFEVSCMNSFPPIHSKPKYNWTIFDNKKEPLKKHTKRNK